MPMQPARPRWQVSASTRPKTLGSTSSTASPAITRPFSACRSFRSSPFCAGAAACWARLLAMFKLGLTGSIGMGKSATAAMFRAAGVPVHDADEVVHALYRGRAAPLIAAAFPGTVSDGVVDRAALSKVLFEHESRLRVLERLVHPLVREERDKFLAANAH